MPRAAARLRSLARRLALAALASAALSGCEGEGPAIEARPQTIAFAAAPVPAVNQATVTVSATASSGLPVRYGSATAAVCSVGASTGVVTAAASGTCTITANQAGDTRFAPAPQVTQDVVFTFVDVLEFSAAPALRVHDQATVAAVASTGAAATYESAAPAICSVDRAAGLVIALAEGDCTILASAGALRASQTLAVAAAPSPSTPGAPTGVVATAGEAPGTVVVSIGAVQAGGRPITGFAVSSSPAGVTASAAASPITVPCPAGCAGYRFTVTAASEVGAGPASDPADVITRYRVVATFREPDTQPNDSIFVGTFSFDATTGVASGLAGRLSESMTGGATPYPDDTMTWLPLTHPLSAVPVVVDGAEGLLVTTFLLETTDTLSSDPRFGGTDGWAPGTGMALHHGYPGPNPGNAYARVFVNRADPTATLTQAQLDLIAYADCAPGGMMGGTCMTGTSEAGYGIAGSMGGHPVSQVTARR
jgi:hypothetical protein